MSKSRSEILYDIASDIFEELATIHFIRDYIDLQPECPNFITIAKLLSSVEENIGRITARIEECTME